MNKDTVVFQSRVVYQKDQKGLKFYVKWSQAEKVFGALLQRLSEKGPPYNVAHVPQAKQFLPSNLEHGSKQHAIFLFCLCLWMRGGVESDTAASFLKTMYENRPDVFDPEDYWDFGPDITKKQIAKITGVLIEHRLGQRVDDNAPGWVYNMRKLARFWGSDPRKLMNDKPRFSTLTRRIIGRTVGKEGQFINEDSPNGFMYFREKMTAMIAYFLMDVGLVPMFYTPVPVDFHVLRLLVSNQVIRVRGKDTLGTVGIDFMKAAVQKLARQVTEWYCRKYEISPIALCDSLWLLSRELCRLNPGNSGYVVDGNRDDKRRRDSEKKHSEEESHPMFEMEIDSSTNSDAEVIAEIDSVAPVPKGRKRYLGLKHRDAGLMRKSMLSRISRSCEICPLKNTCRFNISSGAYYTGGMLLPERLRFIPPDNQSDIFSGVEHTGFFTVRVDSAVRFAKIHLE